MKRIKLRDRVLPNYTKAEETFNAVTHLLGAALGLAALAACVFRAKGPWAVIGSAVYGCALVLLYAMSSIYHGLPRGTAKKVLQVLDHCTIYLLIAGTYTPILFCSIRPVSPGWAWVLFGLVWGCAVLGTVFTAIDLEHYSTLSMVCYIGMGWCIILAAPTAIRAIPLPGLLWLLAGGVAYTLGAVFYGLGRNRRWMHGIFHLFVLAGSILQFLCIWSYIL